MSKTIIDENINIDLRPAKVEIPGTTDITLGDLHSNAIKLLYFLVRHGICDISDEHYARLVQIYRTPQDHLTKDLLDEYNTLIAGMTVINHEVLVRLIGDELGDRGSNDYFVIKMLQKLSKDKVKLEILLSNHGVEFVEAYERFVERDKKFETTLLDREAHAPSLQALANLVERGLVDAKEIFDFVNSSYKPSLKAISYTLDPTKPGITIFSHAGVGLASIKALAKKFEVTYQDGTDRELAATIDSINECFAEYVRKDRVHTLLDPAEMYKGYTARITYKEENALEFIMWNRNYHDLDRPVLHDYGYPVSFAHGHDKSEATRENIYVLDSDLGKTSRHHEGNYISLVTDELQLLELEYQAALDQLKALKAQRHDARLDESFDALVAEIEHLKQEGKVATPELTTALNNTHSRLTGGLTHDLYSEYANTVQGKSSLALKILGGLMLALSITAVVLGVVFFPAVVGLVGTAAAAVSLSLTGTAAAAIAGETVVTTSALFAAGGLGFFALSRQNGLSKAMSDVNQAQVQIEAESDYTADTYSAA